MPNNAEVMHHWLTELRAGGASYDMNTMAENIKRMSSANKDRLMNADFKELQHIAKTHPHFRYH